MNPIRRLSYNNPIRGALRSVRNHILGPPLVVNCYNTYSQAGEDRILWFLFTTMRIDRPSYIDIGACRPDFGSNTYLYYLGGSKGVCIEPDPRIYDALCRGRNRETCINAAVTGGEEGEVELFLFDEPSMNTLLREEAQRRDEAGECRLVGSVMVPTVRLEQIIDRHFQPMPDFISLDIEGVDYEVLSTFDFGRYPVPVWLVETVDYSPSHVKPKVNRIASLMKNKGYFVYADTYVNTLFVNRDWFYSIER